LRETKTPKDARLEKEHEDEVFLDPLFDIRQEERMTIGIRKVVGRTSQG
jgi:hypothetical protein